MKRFVSVFLSVLMLLCCVIPVSATGLDSSSNGYSIDLTPYFDDLHYELSGSGMVNPLCTFESEYTFTYIDILFRTDSTDFRIGTYNSYLTIVNISGNLYRAFGYNQSAYFDFDIFYFEYNNGSYVDFSQIKTSMMDYTVDHIPLRYSITGSYKRQVVDVFSDDQPATNEWFDININSSASNPGSINTPLIEPNINSDGSFRSHNSINVFLTTYLYFDWRAYDRVDLYFYNNFTELRDYACYVGSTNVVSSIQQVFIDDQKATIVTLDFTDLNRDTDNSNCYIRLRGYADLSSSKQHQLYYIFNAVGFVKYASSNFWPSWLMRIINKLDNIFTGREQDQAGADSFNDSINDQADELEDLTADLNSVTRPPLSDVNLSTSGMVDQSVVVLATNGIGSILSNQIILRVLIMSLTFALAGFILFGKR